MTSRWTAVAMLALLFVACEDAPTEVDRVTVRIDGPDVLRFESIGEEVILIATVEGDPLAELPHWSTSRASVATVDITGRVRAAGDGTAVIVARSGTASDSVRIEVEQTATQVLFMEQPADALQGVPFFEPVRVALTDALGTPMRAGSPLLRVALDAAGNGGTLSGTTSRTASGGVAIFDDLSVSVAGSGYRLIASGPVSNGEVSAAGGPFDVVAAPDVILLRNTDGDPNGLLVDGGNGHGAVNDLGIITADSSAEVVLASGAASNEVLALTRGRPPALVPAPWTPGVDTVTVTFAAPIRIALTVWIVRGPYEQQRQRAANAIATTESIWDTERMGVSFSDIEFVDATGNAAASTFFAWTLCALQPQAATTIGKRVGKINVYYVQTVDGGTDRGRACGGGDFIVMAERSGHELLSHEIGHLYSLGHVDGNELFDQTNVMHSASNARAYLTEGQVFRSHFNSSSALRITYAARTDPPRNCPGGLSSLECVPNHRRLWADGLFPPNGAAQSMNGAAIVSRWLLSNCGVGGDAVPAAQLRSLGDAATDVLLAAADGRPDAAAMGRVMRAASARWAALRARLRAGERSGLDADARAKLLAIDERTYVARAAEDFINQWRAEALRGLGVVRSTRAVSKLQAVAADSSALAEVARQALRRSDLSF